MAPTNTRTSPSCEYFTALPIRLPSATDSAASGASITRLRSPSSSSSSGLPPSCARCASSSCSATRATLLVPCPRSLRDSSNNAPIRSLHCCSALDALQALQHLFVQAGRVSSSSVAPDHRQRRAQLMADVGIELRSRCTTSVSREAVVQCLCSCPTSSSGNAAPAAQGHWYHTVGAQPCGPVRYRLHHLRGRPPAQHQ